jgi:hypothetical protein
MRDKPSENSLQNEKNIRVLDAREASPSDVRYKTPPPIPRSAPPMGAVIRAREQLDVEVEKLPQHEKIAFLSVRQHAPHLFPEEANPLIFIIYSKANPTFAARRLCA